MMQNQNIFGNNQNFKQGGDTNVSIMNTHAETLLGKGLSNNINNMNSSQIQRLINSMKIETKNVNPQTLQKMHSSQIEEMIEQMKKNININNNIPKEENKKIDKQELFEKIKNLRKIAAEKQKKINNVKNKISTQNLNDSSDESAIIEISNDSDESDNSERTNELTKNELSKKISKKTISKKVDDTNNIILIKSEQYAEPEFFNDYLIELDKTYKNVKCIEIPNYTFPKLEKEIEITNDNSEFTFSIDNDEQSIELEHGVFSVDKIITTIQDVLDNAEIDLKLNINNNTINIEHTQNEEFILLNNNNSILRELGFTKDIYENETNYTADNQIIIDKIYMFIDNISSTEPIGLIDLKKTKIIKKEFKTPINELKEIIVKFKLNKDYDELVNFYNKPHQFNLKIT
jgi:hypothetical protein